MEAISCKIFTFFISYHLFKCIIPYFLREFKIFSHSRIQITPKACISSATCCGISSMRSIVYHQAAGRCTLKRDDIQGRNAPLMICTALRAAMICQACGLDKKKRTKLMLRSFLGRLNEPAPFCLSKPQAWYIIRRKSVYHQGRNAPLHLITRQRASLCGLMKSRPLV